MTLRSLVSSNLGYIVLVFAVVVTGFNLGHIVSHSTGSARPTIQTPRSVVPAPDGIVATTSSSEETDLLVSNRDVPLLILVLSTDCPFCQQNIANWRTIVESLASAAPQNTPEIVVLSRSSADETKAFLADAGLHVHWTLFVTQEQLAWLGIRGVPATVMVSAHASEIVLLSGILTEEAQHEILEWAGVADASSADAP